MTHPISHRPSVLARSAMVAGLFAASGATAAAAQEQPAQPQQAQPQQALEARVLAKETLSPTTELNATETTIAPGHVSPSHRHDGSVFVYVLEGEIRSRIDDGPIVLYRAGDSWFEALGVEHSFFENASDENEARFLVVRVGPPREPRAEEEE